ncbi:hypothetical protein MPNE_0617 [Mycoplasmoides pneumoniae FH]|uniref:Uncharacterized protein n=1 Tax=Mycoplasmoides pneumoniae (strain ATCC 15531 / DSM 23978 / CIP 103766 / NBRC 14401 / NCTC 10119 / FH) TaxID=722438 RepID=A0A0H3DJV5_MYCPB|nr:hypothetical protein MPNE_0617 [Mycoplasmoides pneumoniae FH]
MGFKKRQSDEKIVFYRLIYKAQSWENAKFPYQEFMDF